MWNAEQKLYWQLPDWPLMLIAMYEDEHEFEYEMLRVYVAEQIWPYKKAWAELASKFLGLNIVV